MFSPTNGDSHLFPVRFASDPADEISVHDKVQRIGLFGRSFPEEGKFTRPLHSGLKTRNLVVPDGTALEGGFTGLSFRSLREPVGFSAQRPNGFQPQSQFKFLLKGRGARAERKSLDVGESLVL